MRITKCDVCGEDYGPEKDMVEMAIPASFLDDDDEPILMDVCSWTCLGYVTEAGKRSIDQTPDEPEEPEKVVEIPKLPTIDADMDEKTLARFTEQATGVKRR